LNHERIPFDRLTWVRFLGAVHAILHSTVGGRVKLFVGTLFTLLLVINTLNVVNSYVGRDFMTAIENRRMSTFMTMGLLYLAVFAASTVTAVFQRYTEERLGLLSRDWFTRNLLERYLRHANYYWLRDNAYLANPDQRIAEDVRSFSTMTLSFMLIMLNNTITILAFSGVLWSISPLLFAVAVGYAALGSGLMIVFGRPLLWLNYNQSDREASLRAELVHLRENAVTVALLRHEGELRRRVLGRIDALVANTRRIINVNRNINFFTTGYNYLIQLIPIVIVAPMFIRGETDFGVVTQSAMAFSHVIGAFSLIVTQFQQISLYAAVIARLSAIIEATEPVEEGSEIELDASGTEIAYQDLTLRGPRDGRLLVRELRVTIPAGTRVQVTGPNQAPRVALFRATAGLWNRGSGRIVCPPPGAVFFLPERPYLPPGSLREALSPASRKTPLDDVSILDVLRALHVDGVLERAGGLDVERDWDEHLSLGEQKSLSLARLVLAAPRFALLDRPGNVLDLDAVTRALDLLAQRSITAITFESAPELAAFHDMRLELASDGSWKLERITLGATA